MTEAIDYDFEIKDLTDEQIEQRITSIKQELIQKKDDLVADFGDNPDEGADTSKNIILCELILKALDSDTKSHKNNLDIFMIIMFKQCNFDITILLNQYDIEKIEDEQGNVVSLSLIIKE